MGQQRSAAVLAWGVHLGLPGPLSDGYTLMWATYVMCNTQPT
jgi:hypothetical protein